MSRTFTAAEQRAKPTLLFTCERPPQHGAQHTPISLLIVPSRSTQKSPYYRHGNYSDFKMPCRESQSAALNVIDPPRASNLDPRAVSMEMVSLDGGPAVRAAVMF